VLRKFNGISMDRGGDGDVKDRRLGEVLVEKRVLCYEVHDGAVNFSGRNDDSLVE
jgi:hypothetical protein